ncbi:uncharacterized protein LOC128982648 isoform X1 [Macrosteles quadrilineatus]|uniref:uncharacterized protein LOC128982648 isoform X1 n=1 Tax=Macrosteles quadrilineatus TaxID=74068 RepID=UPI0023E0F985|nr:uncharacterized protein LOC128982648 isoform X1 [Macrosteles quadrilineatus]
MANIFYKWWYHLCVIVVVVGCELIDMNYVEDNIIEDVIVTPCYLDMGYIDLDKYGVDDSSRTTQMDPHDYVRLRRTSPTPTVAPYQRPRGRQKGKIGRPRKTTLFPVVTRVARVLKKRIKWDDNMNKFVMHSYYYVTKLETDKEQWRPKLRQKFVEVYPGFDSVTEQRLADQKRVIIQNLLLDRKVLVEIKRAVRKQLEMEGVTVTPVAEFRDKSFYN